MAIVLTHTNEDKSSSTNIAQESVEFFRTLHCFILVQSCGVALVTTGLARKQRAFNAVSKCDDWRFGCHDVDRYVFEVVPRFCVVPV